MKGYYASHVLDTGDSCNIFSLMSVPAVVLLQAGQQGKDTEQRKHALHVVDRMLFLWLTLSVLLHKKDRRKFMIVFLSCSLDHQLHSLLL